MPTLPHVSTLSAHMAEAMADSPGVRVARRHFSTVHPEPIQPLREIRASGFDAIVQMTDEAIRMALNHSLGTSRVVVDSPIPVDLDSTLVDELADRVAAERIEAEVIAWPIRPERMVVALEPSALQTRLSLSYVRVSHGTHPTVSVRLLVALAVVATETAASYEARVDRSSFSSAPPPYRNRIPAGSDPVSANIPIGSVPLIVSGPVSMHVDAYRFSIDAYLDFASANVNSRDGSAWVPTVLDLVTPLIQEWGHKTLAPSIRLFGDPPSSPVPEATRLDVTVIGLPSNRLGSLLSFCMETVAGTAAPDPTQVGAFTGSGNFAFFATAPVIRGTVLSRWRTLPRRELEWTVPMTIERDGERRQASARIRLELGDAHWATMSYGSQYMSDNILVYANFRSQVLSARLGGRDISSELGDLATAHETRELFGFFADYSPVQLDIEPIEDWLVSVGRHVLPPLLRPVSSSWRLRGDFETQVSTPLSAIVTRGDLV